MNFYDRLDNCNDEHQIDLAMKRECDNDSTGCRTTVTQPASDSALTITILIKKGVVSKLQNFDTTRL